MFLNIINRSPETEVCFLHIQLIGTNVWLSKNAKCSSWCWLRVFKVSCEVRVLKQSQSALFSSITHMTILSVFTCVMNIWNQSIQAFVTACVLRVPHRGSHRPVFEAHPGVEHLSIRVRSYHDQLHGPIRFSQHLFSVHDHGRQRSRIRPTLHWAVSVRRSTTGRWPSRQRPRSRLRDAGRPLEPWVCRHTREPTVLSRVSCRPSHLNVDRFHQPCLLPWRTSRIGEDCYPVPRGDHSPFLGSPVLPPSRFNGVNTTPQMTFFRGAKRVQNNYR